MITLTAREALLHQKGTSLASERVRTGLLINQETGVRLLGKYIHYNSANNFHSYVFVDSDYYAVHMYIMFIL